jgi:hypothetical protein
MSRFIQLIIRGFGWRLGTLAAVAVVVLIKHFL